VPWRIVDGNVDVTESWRYIKRALADTARYADSPRVLDKDEALLKLLRQRRIDDQAAPAAGSSIATSGEGPPNVLCTLCERRWPQTWWRPPERLRNRAW
jgi:hypothetical protein